MLHFTRNGLFRRKLLFSIGAVPFGIPTSSEWEIQLLLLPPNCPLTLQFLLLLLIWSSFNNSSGLKWYLLVAFVCVSLMINDVEHLFVCSFATQISSLVECLLKTFCLFKNLECCFLIAEFLWFIYCRYKSFVGYVMCKYFLQVCGLSFHSPNCVLPRSKVFNFCKVSFV